MNSVLKVNEVGLRFGNTLTVVEMLKARGRIFVWGFWYF